MDTLNFVNLIQATTAGVSILGSILLWRKKSFKGVALLLSLITFASIINILEETGITRDIYLMSPIFIMLFGPANYLAIKHDISGKLETRDWIHLVPIILTLMFTSHIAVVIAIGTLWRLSYAYLTATILLQFKLTLDQERSDSDEFSLNWLIWVVVGTALFTFIDLMRLNSQQLISYQLNVLGQGVNNFIWLFAVMVIIVKLIDYQSPLKMEEQKEEPVEINDNTSSESVEDYRSTFEELNQLIMANQWYLTPRLTLNDVSKLTGLQTRDISRAINTETKKSFNEYINEYRIKHICQALDAQSTLSLTRLYTDAGFSSKASFNKVFKVHTGMTPSGYKSKKAK